MEVTDGGSKSSICICLNITHLALPDITLWNSYNIHKTSWKQYWHFLWHLVLWLWAFFRFVFFLDQVRTSSGGKVISQQPHHELRPGEGDWQGGLLRGGAGAHQHLDPGHHHHHHHWQVYKKTWNLGIISTLGIVVALANFTICIWIRCKDSKVNTKAGPLEYL